jgi:hypothetical protein
MKVIRSKRRIVVCVFQVVESHSNRSFLVLLYTYSGTARVFRVYTRVPQNPPMFSRLTTAVF